MCKSRFFPTKKNQKKKNWFWVLRRISVLIDTYRSENANFSGNKNKVLKINARYLWHALLIIKYFWSETSNISWASKMVLFATRIRATNEDLWDKPFFIHIQWTAFEVKLLISRWQLKWFCSRHESAPQTKTLETSHFFVHFQWTAFEVKLLISRWQVKWFRLRHESMSWTKTFEKSNFHSYSLW